ncbi:hypothetical protein [Microbulbifer sp. THAF38]|uniref:hypothetical protein n=1 Tax=Microbulbifer sp. THAF38 TaxID=2587856 RepID=UPI001267957A|nr:hypothetical protein [Microbulbifer sp. THAF38]QFT57104.1 hypothetical protein FIU95_21365 [Microbulbifer sp. THAF38]
MSNDFVVLHYQDDSSDKIWAINKVANANNSHTVWFGSRGSILECRRIGYKTWSSLMQSKLDEGYREVENVTIDVQNNVVVPFMDDEISTSLWYRVSRQVPVTLISDYLNITIQLLSERHEKDLERLKKLPIFLVLQDGKTSGGADYKEGPLALMLLFGLRRYLNDIAGSSETAELMQIANDANELLPERFAQIEQYIEMFCESMFISNGWMSDRTSVVNWKEYVDCVARQYGLSHYTSITGIKSLAIAMGCIDAPIDLMVIHTETKAAFF